MAQRVRQRKTPEEIVEEIEAAEIEDDRPVEFIHSGSTVLNLAGSQRAKNGGWARGRIANIVGDGSSGKTLDALETANRFYRDMPGRKSDLFPTVRKVDITYNNVEGVMDFPVGKMYGKDFLKSVNWIRTATVEAFGRDVKRRADEMQEGDSHLYIIDSFDGLKSAKEVEQFKNEEDQEGYRLEKARYTSEFFRNIADYIEDRDMTIVIVSQTRTRIGVTFGKKKYRTGGEALNFWTHQVCWLSERKKLFRTIGGRRLDWGIRVVGKFERNKVSIPFREGEFLVIFNYGIDDLQTMLDFLYGPEEKRVTFDGKPFSSKRGLYEWAMKNDAVGGIISAVEEKWFTAEKKLEVERIPKY